MNMNINEDTILSMDEFCKLLDIGKNVAYQLLNSGQVKAFRLGRLWRIPKSSVESFVQERMKESAQQARTQYVSKTYGEDRNFSKVK